jgi:hypothetical protein
MPLEIGPEQQVNTYTKDSQVAPQITALKDGGWVVTWYSNGQLDWSDVYQQRYSSTGALVGSESRVNPGSGLGFQWFPDVASLENGWVVTYRSDVGTNSSLI